MPNNNAATSPSDLAAARADANPWWLWFLLAFFLFLTISVFMWSMFPRYDIYARVARWMCERTVMRVWTGDRTGDKMEEGRGRRDGKNVDNIGKGLGDVKGKDFEMGPVKESKNADEAGEGERDDARVVQNAEQPKGVPLHVWQRGSDSMRARLQGGGWMKLD